MTNLSEFENRSNSYQISDVSYPRSNSLFYNLFKPINKGAVRSNVFLVISTTLGAAFFLLPCLAKEIGIVLIFCLLLLSFATNNIMSHLLFLGFQETNATSYQNYVSIIFGKKYKYLCDLILLLHLTSSYVSTSIFSYYYFESSIENLFYYKQQVTMSSKFTYSFFGGLLILICVVNLINRIEFLKKISRLTLVLISYLIIVFCAKMPKYFKYYSAQPYEVYYLFNFSWKVLPVWGVCLYILVNQYSLFTVFHNFYSITKRRFTKMYLYASYILVFVYTLMICIGFLSSPYFNCSENFCLRPQIDEGIEYTIQIGKLVFSFSLMISISVKSYFMLSFLNSLFGFNKADFDDTSKKKICKYVVNFIYLFIYHDNDGLRS